MRYFLIPYCGGLFLFLPVALSYSAINHNHSFGQAAAIIIMQVFKTSLALHNFFLSLGMVKYYYSRQLLVSISKYTRLLG